MSSKKRLITLRQATEVIPVSYARLASAARENLLPVVRLGRQVFVDPDRLTEFIDAGGAALPGGWRRQPRDAA